MASKWHDSHVPLFLERFQAYECLWNKKCKGYKDRHQRNKAIRSLKEDLNIDGVTENDIRLKIKSIRTRYGCELNKIKRSTKNAGLLDEVYVPKLFWFAQADAFLNSVYNSRSSSSNLDIEINVKTKRENENSDPLAHNSECKDRNQINLANLNETPSRAAVERCSNNLHQQCTNDAGEGTLSSTAISGHSTPSTSQPPKNYKQEKKILNDMLINRAIKQLKEINNANKKEDEFDLFCRSLAIQLKSMPIKRALLCQEKLQSVIVRERLKFMEEDCPVYFKDIAPSATEQSASDMSN